jgi:hydroxyacylglutathione hydrolase
MTTFEVAQFFARSDNFGVLLHDPASGATAAIDAPDADAVMQAAQARGWVLSHIFVTHHHFDHIEGIPALKASYSCEVIGPEKSASRTGMYDRTVADGETFEWASAEVRVIATPGHTLDHVSYWLPEQKLVFVGDTVFSLGCGRVIEGDHATMWESIRRLRDLPEETALYCGHEYTLANAKFAVTVDPGNKALAERMAEVERLRAAGEATLPTTIGQERATNPFLRADNAAIATAVGLRGADPAKVFAEIRTRKDRF